MGLISVIIPVYNGETYITRCLDSIINQVNRPSIEIIIVDDGSTDNTANILETYSQEFDFIKVIKQKNQKQSVARNNGLKSAVGEYVMFIDSDDYLEENMLSSMYNQLLKEKTDLCICGITKRFTGRTEVETVSCLKDSKDFIADYLTDHQEMDVGLWNKIFKRSIILNSNLEFENGNFFEDTLFVFKYLCNVRNGISFVEEPYYNLLKREDSTTTSFSPEIEQYADKLSGKINLYLSDLGLNQYEKQVIVLENRSLLHIIHHHIKYNKKNVLNEITRLVSKISFKSISLMPIKYKVALLLLKITPKFYMSLYKSKKND